MGSSLEVRLRGTLEEHVPGVAVAVVETDGIRDAVGVGMADIARDAGLAGDGVPVVLDDEDRDRNGRDATHGARRPRSG